MLPLGGRCYRPRRRTSYWGMFFAHFDSKNPFPGIFFKIQRKIQRFPKCLNNACFPPLPLPPSQVQCWKIKGTDFSTLYLRGEGGVFMLLLENIVFRTYPTKKGLLCGDRTEKVVSTEAPLYGRSLFSCSLHDFCYRSFSHRFPLETLKNS